VRFMKEAQGNKILKSERLLQGDQSHCYNSLKSPL
jgi:hypothetical protein